VIQKEKGQSVSGSAQKEKRGLEVYFKTGFGEED
jgi:hypothetical protein